jgi:transcription elongation factor Elf1
MSQAQLKQSDVPVTVSCSHCQMEQVVHIRAHGGFWSTAHQWVKCLNCGQEFEVQVPDAIIAGPFYPW